MEPPEPPDPDDCCNSGCNPCILDVYEQQLRKYNEQSQIKSNGTSCMSPVKFSVFKVSNIVQHTANTRLYTFDFVHFNREDKNPDKNYVVKYEAGQHFFIKAKNHEGEFSKAYTPLKPCDLGAEQFVVLIKLYRNGEMSNYFRKLKLNDCTLWRGPYGDFRLSYMYKNILFIAQGTGIAPFYSIIQNILNNEDCVCFLKLFFCCRSCDEILLRDELYKFSTFWNFTYEVFLSSLDNFNCKYNETVHKEKLSEKHLMEYLDKNTTEALQVLICGSEEFSLKIKSDLLKIHSELNVVVF